MTSSSNNIPCKTSCAWCDSTFCSKYFKLNKGDKEKYIVYCMKKVFDPSLKGCDNKKCCTSLARKISFTFFKLHYERSILDMQICTLFLLFNNFVKIFFILSLVKSFLFHFLSRVSEFVTSNCSLIIFDIKSKKNILLSNT